jgi:hypothetical protein
MLGYVAAVGVAVGVAGWIGVGVLAWAVLKAVVRRANPMAVLRAV